MPDLINRLFALVRLSMLLHRSMPCFAAALMYEVKPPFPPGTEKKGCSIFQFAELLAASKNPGVEQAH